MTIRSLVMAVAVVAVFSACPVRPSGTDAGKGGGGSLLTGGGFTSGGGTTGGGSTAGGSTGGGAAGGSTSGGSTAGGSTAGGSTAGGSTAGGSTAGGSTAGGSTAGGSTAGGSTAGGSAVPCPGGFGWNGTDFSIAAARCAQTCRDYLEVRDVVVTAIENSFIGSLGDSQATFWVADPAGQGMWIRKDFTDLPRTWQPQVGDLLNIRGFYQRQFSNVDRTAYRFHLGEGCNAATRNDGGVLVVEHVDGGVAPPAIITAMPGFGDAMGGEARPNPELASLRVFIPGPVTLTNFRPPALTRYLADAGVGGHNGFEITGGILVNNFATFGNYPDGGPRCDWRALASALDAGTASGGTYVTFPNGLTGVWDTYAHAPCLNGNGVCSSTGTGQRPDASVPFTNNSQTYVLYPTECAELQGMVQ